MSVYTCAEGLYEDERLRDICVRVDERQLCLLGVAGEERDYAHIKSYIQAEREAFAGQQSQAVKRQKYIPVLLGLGLGLGLARLVDFLQELYGEDFHIVLIDKEIDLPRPVEFESLLQKYQQIMWIQAGTEKEAQTLLYRYQQENDFLPFFPVQHPFYLRLDRLFYKQLAELCSISKKANLHEKLFYPRFQNNTVRILFFTQQYFLMGELVSACERLGIPHLLVTIPQKEVDQEAFVAELLNIILEFKPDCILTLNHLGVDSEGVLVNLLERLRLPLVSWFVDNPALVLDGYHDVVSDWSYIFSWDKDTIAPLKKIGFSHLAHLPLGVDTSRFFPRKKKKDTNKQWQSRISFIGNSMLHKVESKLQHNCYPLPLLQSFYSISEEFAWNKELSVKHFLSSSHPHIYEKYANLKRVKQRLEYEAAITWEATLRYRLAHVKAILPLSPLIVGDSGWFDLLSKEHPWRYHSELSYYDSLPQFYPCSDINFNVTSRQMKGAVNQRVFDVPACRAFLLTDFQEQVLELFELDREVVCFSSPEEAHDKAQYYLRHPEERTHIAHAAYERVLSDHDYTKRLCVILQRVKEVFQ